MDKRLKKRIGLIISFFLILGGLFIILRIYFLLNNFKRNIDTIPIGSTNLPISFSVSFVEPLKKVITDNRLIIHVIDVNLEIGTEQRFLDIGGWIVKTDDKNIPVAIAIHRFGLSDLTNDQRIHQTLLHVDKLRINDLVTLDWNGMEYLYKVRSINIDTNNPPIGDNELLLYTCEYWASPERMFVLLQKQLN